MENKIWDDIVNYLISKQFIDDYAYNVWFKNLHVEIKDDQVLLYFPTRIAKDKFEKEYLQAIQKGFSEIVDHQLKINLIIEKKEQKKDDSKPDKTGVNQDKTKDKTEGNKGNDKQKPIPNKRNGGFESSDVSIFQYNQAHHLNPRYTFDNFIIGKNNQFCAAAAQRVAKYPGQNFNPLFIYGSVGLGKTHALQAIAHYIHLHYPDMNVVYIPVDQFINEFIYSLQNKQMEFFRLKYRKADILLLDDIQFLEKKDASMEEFFHTFNILHQAQKQMVFTCDRPPKDLKDFEERVRNRMEWGLTVRIAQPDFETRVAILNKKAEIENRKFNPELIKFIAKSVRSSIRDLESALIKIIAYCDIFNADTETFDVEKAGEILKDQLKFVEEKKIVQIDDIIRKVGEVFKVSTVDIKSKKRNQSIALARNVAMFLSRELTGSSTTEIGLSFGGKDHTTIIHASNKISRMIEDDSILRATIDTIKKDLSL